MIHSLCHYCVMRKWNATKKENLKREIQMRGQHKSTAVSRHGFINEWAFFFCCFFVKPHTLSLSLSLSVCREKIQQAYPQCSLSLSLSLHELVFQIQHWWWKCGRHAMACHACMYIDGWWRRERRGHVCMYVLPMTT